MLSTQRRQLLAVLHGVSRAPVIIVVRRDCKEESSHTNHETEQCEIVWNGRQEYIHLTHFSRFCSLSSFS